MIFDILYWNFGFLRVGTGGLAAQAYGRRDFKDAIKVFSQGVSTSIFISTILIAFQYLLLEGAFLIIDCSGEVEAYSREYFKIRIWAAPATLSLFVFKGWFIGMQNTISPMVTDIVVNVVNVVLSIYFALYAGMGFAGVALGTLIAQYTGLLVAIVITWVYYKKLFRYFNFKESAKLKEIAALFKLNGNLFLRSLCFMAIYAGFTTFSARYGDTLLAVSSILMKLMMLFSYLVDGFAYAGEALAGKYIGAKDYRLLRKAVRLLFVWSLGIGVVSTFAYFFLGDWMVAMVTNTQDVRGAASPFMFWLLIMPIVSCAAFMWDGIFIGATASVTIRNCMFYSVIAFYVFYFAFEGVLGIQALWLGYFAHLAVRTIFLTFKYFTTFAKL